MGAVEHFSGEERNTVPVHYLADLLTGKVSLDPVTIRLLATFPISPGSGLWSLWEAASCSAVDTPGSPHQGGEERAGWRKNAMMG